MLSEDKLTHMTHILLKGLLKRDAIDIIEEEGIVRRAIKKAINTQLKIGEEMDLAVRRKISSMSKQIPEGSPEWEVLYRKFQKEEEGRRGIKG